MMNGSRFGWWWGGSVVLGLALLAAPLVSSRQVSAAAQSPASQSPVLNEKLPQRFTAFATNMAAMTNGPRAETVELQIDHWSTESQRDELLSVLKEKGQDGLLSALQKLPRVGYIRTPDSIGYDLHYARQEPWGDGGRRIFIATDRYINFWEAVNKARTIDYPFTLIELHLGHNDQGEGKLSIATKVTLEDNQLVLENYADQPVMLRDVKEEK